MISTVADQSIDILFAIETICYFPKKAEVLNAVYKKLKSNSAFLLFDIFLGSAKKAIGSNQ